MSYWKENFYLNQQEKRRIKILLVIIFLLIILLFLQNPIMQKHIPPDDVTLKEIALFESKLIDKDSAFYAAEIHNEMKAQYDTLKLFKFNPNLTGEDEFLQLGFSRKQLKNLSYYFKQKKSFKYKEDLKYLKGMHPEQFAKLEPYIDLPSRPQNSKGDKNLEFVQDFNLQDFDPNTVNAEMLASFGLSEKLIKTIENFRNKGGKFRKKEDFGKLYGISQDKYNELEPFIQIASNNKSEIIYKQVEINSADQNMLVESRLFTEKTAQFVIKYRNLLGGFFSKEQIKEVYSITPERYSKIEPYITLNPALVNKIKINFINEFELSRHPYISKEEAKKITSYRNHKGAFKDLNQLIEKKLISEDTYTKVKAYLEI